MKKYKLFLSSLFLALTLLTANIHPGKVYASDPSNGPQGTSQKKDTPPISSEVVAIIMALLWMF